MVFIPSYVVKESLRRQCGSCGHLVARCSFGAKRFETTHQVIETTIGSHIQPRYYSFVPTKVTHDVRRKESQQERRGISKTEIHHEEKKRIKLSDVLISQVLRAKHSFRWVDPVIPENATVKEAIDKTIEDGLSGMMVLDSETKRVVGLLTSRDILRIMFMGIKDGESNDNIMNRVIGNYMTPISQVIYGRPDETVGMCRTIMAKLGIKCLPILGKEGRVEGLITARDMSDFGLSAKDKGGKKSFLDDVSERVGLSSDTLRMAEPPRFLKGHLALEQSQSPLFINVGISELPHPFKTKEGVGMSHRDFGIQEYSTDPALSEDAYFVASVELPDAKGENIVEVIYMGVADGVGSWREYGVDPRNFSRRLMSECEEVVLDTAMPRDPKSRKAIAPSEILRQAFESVKEAGVIGSSTACVAMFDSFRHQVHFSNLGDSGIIVLRHIDSDIAGSLKRDRKTPRTERKSDLQVTFVSQQQLLSFNHPFQLGFTGAENENGTGNTSDDDSNGSSLKSVKDACVSSIHVRRGDIILMATDGLFDNVDIDDICSITLEWEEQNGFVRGGDIVARERRWKMGNSLTVMSSERIGDLAKALVERARQNSLDSSVDSPFAILAKENDIMWSGGMPDDCTVIAMHVVGRSPADVMDKDHM